MLPKRFLFRFTLPCRMTETLWTNKGAGLGQEFRLVPLEKLETEKLNKSSVDFRLGWNSNGICFSLELEGKKISPWCRSGQPEESDGLHLCIDTRDVRNVHRASRFCHRLVFLPCGGGERKTAPLVFWLPIHRAKSHPNPVELELIKTASKITANGYILEGMIPSETLTGFDPGEFPHIGFHYTVKDQELGEISLLSDSPFPHDYDPSLWARIALQS